MVPDYSPADPQTACHHYPTHSAIDILEICSQWESTSVWEKANVNPIFTKSKDATTSHFL